ncbi:hypothetical protein C8J57DRAFT_1506380 [Mycena rebaudengoi]|nr:hypothetical protein C8J57DRAFT_1506380 [Mycena rebaudengoi]
MATDISPLAKGIVAFTVPDYRQKISGIQPKTRAGLEWAWGLGYGGLEEYLGTFDDPVFMQILVDEKSVIIPPDDSVKQIWKRKSMLKAGQVRPRIQDVYEGCDSFEYIVLDIDPSAPVPPRILFSQVPPHLVICTTYGKLSVRWGDLRVRNFNATLDSLLQLAQTCIPTKPMPDISRIRLIYHAWSNEYIPPRFLGLDALPTPEPVPKKRPEPPVEVSSDNDSDSVSDSEWSSSFYEEPQRRLLSCEGGAHDPCNEGKIRMFPTADRNNYDYDDDDGDEDKDEDDALSIDSHISGVDNPEEYAQKDREHKPNRGFLKRMASWAEGTSGSDSREEPLLNDSQIVEDPTELPRVASALDLTKPDYERLLSKKR